MFKQVIVADDRLTKIYYNCSELSSASAAEKTEFLSTVRTLLRFSGPQLNIKIDRRKTKSVHSKPGQKNHFIFSHNIREFPYDGQKIYVAYKGSAEDPSGSYALIETDTIAFSTTGEILPTRLAVRIEKNCRGSQYNARFKANKQQEIALESQYRDGNVPFVTTSSSTKLATYSLIELAPGNLRDYIKANTANLEFGDIIILHKLILEQVQSLAAKGIAHMDLKLNNIVIKKDPENPHVPIIKLIDFGLSKNFGPGFCVGAYAPLHLFAEDYKQQEIDATYDIASLGLTFLNMITMWLDGQIYIKTKKIFSAYEKAVQCICNNHNYIIPKDPLDRIYGYFYRLCDQVKTQLIDKNIDTDVVLHYTNMLKMMIAIEPTKRPKATGLIALLTNLINHESLTYTTLPVSSLIQTMQESQTNQNHYIKIYQHWCQKGKFRRAFAASLKLIEKCLFDVGIYSCMQIAQTNYLRTNDFNVMAAMYRDLLITVSQHLTLLTEKTIELLVIAHTNLALIQQIKYKDSEKAIANLELARQLDPKATFTTETIQEIEKGNVNDKLPLNLYLILNLTKPEIN